MGAEAAARMGDEIAHGFGLAAMVAGAVAGAVVGVLVVSAVAATGGLAAVIIAGAVAGGGLAMGQIVSGLTTIFNIPEPPSGVIAMGAFNVLTNMRPAVRALLDFAGGCTGVPMNHPPVPVPVPVAEGSATVLINSMPASRLKSKLVCGSHIKSGSENVIIGGETKAMAFVFDLEGWFHTGLEVLGIGALIGGGLYAIAAGALASGIFAATTVGTKYAMDGLGAFGDSLGPGYRDLFQGVAGMGLLLAGPKMARPTQKYIAENELVSEGLGSNFGNMRVRPKAPTADPNWQKPTSEGAWKNAPNPDKWRANGGTTTPQADGGVTYKNAQGTKVTYNKDGHPDFTPHAVDQTTLPDGFTDRPTDFRAANAQTGRSEFGDTSPTDHTWHHHEDGTTMQLIPRDIHRQFTHQGGISKLNSGGGP